VIDEDAKQALETEEDLLFGQEWRTWQGRFENPCMDNKCGRAPTQLGAFLEQKSHSDFFEAFLHPIVNDDILSTADVPFVRLFWSQNSPRTSSVSPPGADLPLYLPSPVYQCLLENLKYERSLQLRDWTHR
jgi:hypothetical protein